MLRLVENYTEPFPICLFKGVLEDSFLEACSSKKHIEISSNLREYTGNINDSSQRRVLGLLKNGSSPSFLKKRYRDEALNFVHEMMKHLQQNCAYDLGDFRAERVNLVQCWDKEGYQNPMHVDSEKKIWTGVIYLFGNGKSSEGGTSFFKEAESSDDKIKFMSTTPEINSAVCFHSTKNSYHSVEPSKLKRQVLLINYNW